MELARKTLTYARDGVTFKRLLKGSTPEGEL